MRKFLTVALALVFVLGLSGLALADSNRAEQEQYGTGDYASIGQVGESNKALQWQNLTNGTSGGDNIAEISQTGDRNRATQFQEGLCNKAYIIQIGDDNQAGSVDPDTGDLFAGQWQSGSEDWFGIGNDNYSSIYQQGNKNRAAQTTVGNRNTAYITQIGSNNDAGFWGASELWGSSIMFNAGQRQFGNNNYAEICQYDEGNKAVQRQNVFDAPGDDNIATIVQYGKNSGVPWGDVVGAAQIQLGHGNDASIYQNGWENYATSVQTGNNNSVTQTQTRDYNYSTVIQTGNGNVAALNQT